MKHEIIIVWFRRDLRVLDNPAFHAAAAQAKILPIYIFDQDLKSEHAIGDGSKWWLHHSLQSLQGSLDGSLRCYIGDAVKILPKLAKEYKVTAVHFNKSYDSVEMKRDHAVELELQKSDIEVKMFDESLLFSPSDILKKDGTPYKVFTPFYRECLKGPEPRIPLPKPRNIEFFTTKVDKHSIESLQLLEDNSVENRFEKHWKPGELSAHKRLQSFIKNGLENYAQGRDFPALKNVSRLSAHIHFGEISAHQIWHEVKQNGHEYANKKNISCLLKELGWREFSYYVLYHNPTMYHKNLQEKFDRFAWRYSKKDLLAWQTGMTGYPIVDASMRELFTTGYMHNRMRMVVASFLVKNLMIDWRTGAQWFWQLLVDADLASNSFNWQWVAGCGYDAAPYFRIFNPITQAKKFDPAGEYIAQFVPELSKLPSKYIAAPWLAPEQVLKKAGIEMGVDYPMPIIDLKESRDRALGSFKALKK
ncbi:MAG: deoxyribodipyrimidine photo-lyase [Candidatus Dependentiae bacterium]|nr:deoxyribodipyrimidine photo-lyase [Candidatus Dependentiae bacterium]